MVLTEIAERKAIQVPAVGGIAKRAEVGVMGRNNNDPAARDEQPVEFFDSSDHISYVFDHVRGANLAEGAVAERKWEMIQVRDDVGSGMRAAIQAYGAGVLVEPAADIENWELAYRTGSAGGCLSFGG
jgi:hypothetical protein